MRKYLALALAACIMGTAALGSLIILQRSPRAVTPPPLVATGTIEGEQVSVTAEIGGRVTEILVDEGQEVHAGDVVMRLDDALLRARLRQAEATVAAMNAQYAKLQAGVRPEERRTLQAALDQAIAQRDGALAAWRNAQAIRAHPQDLDAQIDEAEGHVAIATYQLQQAQAAMISARATKEMMDRLMDAINRGTEVRTPTGTMTIYAPSLVRDEVQTNWGLAGAQYWTAAETVSMAQTALDAAQAHLALLLAIRANPLALDAQVHAAQANYESAEAMVQMAQARLDAAINGPTKEQLDMGRAAIRQAEAAANMLRVQVDKQTLRAPMSGVVGARSIHIGEVAVPGSTLLTIINIDTVKLTIYIAETDMGRVYIGQKVEVLVDAFPREVFPGEVVFVSSQAEFRPRGVQTTEERATQVFAVKVRLPNPEGKLKPGMPVEARLLP